MTSFVIDTHVPQWRQYREMFRQALLGYEKWHCQG
jgi:hypothetical protein